ncbi:EAL domain-containing protein [Magnetospira sp. QH-2]|uniref:EAL domain-containing protein n=1 Tax=Magnetospira sp. (strain QH-2) TaxID=1288970 RepID=UPI0003E8143D|nr:EAL domain-containing protein [Magnetospira sp. QH-2]CCQ73112.1 conserved protein of unknown function [Magnetospira sp. QH-2]
MNTPPIRVLLVEDNLGDARLVEILVQESEARRDSIQFIHVDSLAAALKTLADDTFDVVLLDLSLPDSHGQGTLEKVLSQAPDLPIVVLTGTNNDAFAMAAMQKGAQDFLVKGDGDGRLIARSLRYAIERQRADRAMRDSEARASAAESRLIGAVNSVAEALVLWDADDKLVMCNENYRLFFPNAAAVLDSDVTFSDVIRAQAEVRRYESDQAKTEWIEKRIRRHLACDERFQQQLPDGRWVQISEHRTPDGGTVGIYSDITESKNTQEHLNRIASEQEAVLQNASVGIARLVGERVEWANARFGFLFGLGAASPSGLSIADLFYSPSDYAAMNRDAAPIHAENRTYRAELKLRRKDGTLFWCRFTSRAVAPQDPSQGAILIFEDVEERVQAEQAVKASERLYRTVIDTAVDGYWRFTPDGMTEEINKALGGMLGRNREDIVGRSIADFVEPDNKAILESHLNYLIQNRQASFELALRHLDGRTVYTRISATSLVDDPKTPTSFFAFVTDITDRIQAEEILRLSAAVFENSADAIMITDANNHIKAVNPAFTRITHWPAEEVIGKDPAILNSGRHGSTFFNEMLEELSKSGHWEGEIWNQRKDGEEFAGWLSIAAIRDDQGTMVEYVALFSDITKRKEAEEVIRRQANYDALTQLPNRTLFLERLRSGLVQAKRAERRIGLMFIDLDRFKWVNDTLGHAAGDQLLQQAAERLTGCIRESDTVARLGGDEFTVILSQVAHTRDVERVASKILDRLASMFLIDDTDVFISGSIGITVFPDDGDDVETLLKNADSAMYRAKEGGRNAFRFFTGEIDEKVRIRLEMENDLRHALGAGELSVVYQPIIDLASDRISGAEALLRWAHPEKGPMNPGDFIPLAEETGLITQIGEWVLWTACTQVKTWQEAGLPIGRVSVNISSKQCRQDNFEERVNQILDRTGLAPEFLTLEITETVILEDSSGSANVLNNLHDQGLHLSIDDFGTGYSSLSYLKRYPFDVVKIDRSFIDEVASDAADAALVEAIITMAHGLDLTVVAEGAERQETVDFLKARDCDYIQGYFFSRPLPPADFEAFVEDWAGQNS